MTLLTRLIAKESKTSAMALWMREKALWVQKQLKTLADPRKSRDLKAFNIKFPPGAALVPDEEDSTKITSYELTLEQSEQLSWAILLRMRQQNQGELESNFNENSAAGALFCKIFNFIPSKDFLEEAFNVARHSEDVVEWVSLQDVPSERVGEFVEGKV